MTSLALKQPHIIQEMAANNSLPFEYRKRRLVPNGSYMITGSPVIEPSSRSGSISVLVREMDWYALPREFTDELGKLPWELLIGQGVLFRDYSGNTALISIAEAASLEQKYFPALLGCLLSTIETAMNSLELSSVPQIHYDVSWQYKDYLPSTAKMMVLPTVEQSWTIGLERGQDVRHWLALEILYVLEWLQGIVLPPTTTDKLSLISQPRLFNTRESIRLSLNLSCVCELSATIEAQQLAPVISKPAGGGTGCWRKRIKAGVVIDRWLGDTTSIVGEELGVPDEIPDCLVLTAGALWALFNNTLELIPGCKCTFRSEDGNFVTCVKRSKEWLIWHLETDETEVCNGESCAVAINDMITFGQLLRQGRLFLYLSQAKSVYFGMACIFQSHA
jgi:hypothetical protein